MTDILLTGKDGQVGWEVKRQAPIAGLSVAAMGRQSLDIADRAAVIHAVRTARPRLVVNAAAYTAVDQAEQEVTTAYAVNRDGPGHLAEACSTAGIPLIHISTDYVFDGRKADGGVPVAYTEDDPVAPLGVYGASKEAGEVAIRAAMPQHVILRTAWVYGVHGKNFVKTMLRLGRERPEIRVVDDQHGCPTFARDVAEVILALSKRMIDGAFPERGYGTYHVAGSGSTTWCGFARKVFTLVAKSVPAMPTVTAITTAEFPTAAPRPTNSMLDCGRLSAVHGLSTRPWDEALSDMLDELVEQEGVR